MGGQRMFGKNVLLLLVLTLTLLSSANTAMAKLDIAVIDGTAIPYAKEDHLAYGIVKMWNKATDPVIATVSLIPDRSHRLVDDNRYWGNYREKEDIKIEANELHIQIFCFTIPAGSELGQQTWTLNVTVEGKTITEKVTVNLPVTKNVEIAAPSWKPDILKLELPPAKPDTFTVEEGKPTLIVMLLDIAGDLSGKKIYDVELETVLPDIFFSYPEEITVEMSKPKSWDFDNQSFLPFTVIPIPLLTANVPCLSVNENMYELELQLEEEGTGLKADLPFQLVVTSSSPVKKTVETKTEVIKEYMTTVNVNETVNENAAIIKTVAAVNSSETVTLTTPIPAEEAGDGTGESGNTWQSFIDWFWHSTTGLVTFIISCCVLLILIYRTL